MSTPRISPKPLPRITHNYGYAEDGSPITRFEVETPPDTLPSVAKAITHNGVLVKPLRNGLIAVGDVE